MADYLDELKDLSRKINAEVPIESVLELVGIFPNSHGKYRLREEDDTPSASIYKAKNFIKDFGDNNTLNCCGLVAWRKNLSYKDATLFLAKEFGYKMPEFNKNDNYDNTRVTDWEWKELLIYPDMASKNMLFFPDKWGHEKTREYAEKYRMPMSELKDVDKNMYEKIVNSKGKSRVLELRNDYFCKLYNWYNIRKELNIKFNLDDLKNDNDILDIFKELTNAERILEKAIIGTTLKFEPGKYNVVNDYYKVVNGEVPVEIGQENTTVIQRKANKRKAKVFSTEPLTLDEYYQLLRNGLDTLDHSALRKGDKVVVSFVSTDSSKVNYLVQAMFGKEKNIVEILAESALDFEKRNQEDKVIVSEDDKIMEVIDENSVDKTVGGITNKDVSRDIV